MVHIWNPGTWETETGGSQFKASLSYLARSFLRKRERIVEYKHFLINVCAFGDK